MTRGPDKLVCAHTDLKRKPQADAHASKPASERVGIFLRKPTGSHASLQFIKIWLAETQISTLLKKWMPKLLSLANWHGVQKSTLNSTFL